jgi:hypothetical protein
MLKVVALWIEGRFEKTYNFLLLLYEILTVKIGKASLPPRCRRLSKIVDSNVCDAKPEKCTHQIVRQAGRDDE